VFDVSDRTLELVCEHRIKGAAYCMEAFGSHGLLVGVNNKLQLYDWQPSRAGSTPSLKLRAEHCGHILVLFVAVRGDFILVGDLMKSLSVFQCSQTASGSPILEIARDYNSYWMTSVAFLDDDHYLGSENSLNLFVARKNADATTDDDSKRLEIVGEFGLGEFVNRFRKGSLAMQVADTGRARGGGSGASGGSGGAGGSGLGGGSSGGSSGGGLTPPMPMLLYGTVNGVIGLVAAMPQDDFQFWMKVQGQLTKVIKGVGGFSHAAWRAFSNDRKTVECTGFVDGDLIESFLSLSPAEMAQVCEGLPGIGVDDLTKRVEELTRLH
jgi:DNA damage-binding protein 1